MALDGACEISEHNGAQINTLMADVKLRSQISYKTVNAGHIVGTLAVITCQVIQKYLKYFANVFCLILHLP